VFHSCGIIFKIHNISDAGYASVIRWNGRRNLVQTNPLKGPNFYDQTRILNIFQTMVTN
jgi:hypothetical protein